MEENLENNERAENTAPLESGFKSTCFRLWITVFIAFAVRAAAELLLGGWVTSFDGDKRTLIEFVYSIVFLNIIPIAASIFIMRFNVKTEVPKIYKKPKYFGRALGMFPAGYGLSLLIAILTILAGALIGGTSAANPLHQAETAYGNATKVSAWIELIHAVIFAPILEEFWFRGVIMQSLRPYGNGAAIFMSAMVFGLVHANFLQVFFASAVGVILGYVAVQTGSIYTSIALHAFFNAPASITQLFLTDSNIFDKLLDMMTQETAEYDAEVVIFMIWTLILCVFAVIGLIMAVVKLLHINRYKVPKVQDELTARRRWGILLTRLTIIPALVLIVCVYLRISPQKIADFFRCLM